MMNSTITNTTPVAFRKTKSELAIEPTLNNNSVKGTGTAFDNILKDILNLKDGVNKLIEEFKSGKINPAYTKQLVQDIFTLIQQLAKDTSIAGGNLTKTLAEIKASIDSSFLPDSVKHFFDQTLDMLSKIDITMSGGLEKLEELMKNINANIDKYSAEDGKVANGVVDFLESVDNMLSKLNDIFNGIDGKLKEIHDAIAKDHPKAADAIAWIDDKLQKVTNVIDIVKSGIETAVNVIKNFFKGWF